MATPEAAHPASVVSPAPRGPSPVHRPGMWGAGWTTPARASKLDHLVLDSGSTPLTGPDTAGSARRRIRALCLPVLVVIAALPLGAAPRPAGADPIAGLQSQATAVAHDLVLEQLQVDAAQQLTSVAASRVTADQVAIARLGQQVVVDQQAIAGQLQVVRSQAIRTYVDSGGSAARSAVRGGCSGRCAGGPGRR